MVMLNARNVAKLIVSKLGNYKIISFKSSTIADIKANPISSKKLDTLIAETKSKLEEGYIIYNTNV